MMAPSLQSFPSELIRLVGQYVADELYTAQKKRAALAQEGDPRPSTDKWSWKRSHATGRQLRVIKAWQDLSSVARTCRTVYIVLNDLLYDLATQWLMIREIAMPPLSISYIIDCDWGLVVIDRLVSAGLVGFLGWRKLPEDARSSNRVQREDYQQGEEVEEDDEHEQTGHNGIDDSQHSEDESEDDLEDTAWGSRMADKIRYRGANDWEHFGIIQGLSYLTNERWARLYRSMHQAPSPKMMRRRLAKPSFSCVPENHMFFNRDGTLRQTWVRDDIVAFETNDFSQINPNPPPKGRASGHPSVKAYWSPLHVAASNGKTEILERLLRVGFDPNETSEGFCYCQNVLPEVCFMEREDLESFQFPRWTPLHTAICHGQLEAVRILLRYGADPLNLAFGSKITMLHVAAGLGSVEILDLPVELECFQASWIDSTDSYGLTPLFWAVTNGHIDTCGAWLIRNGADIDKIIGGDCLLRHAVDTSRYSLAIKLIDMGATIPQELSNQRPTRSTILRAAWRPVVSIGSQLFPEQLGDSDHSASDVCLELTIAWPFADTSERSRIELIKRLLQIQQGHDADYDANRVDIMTTLAYLAIESCLPETLHFFLDAGAELDRAKAIQLCISSCSCSPDGSSIATLQVLIEYHLAKDPLWLSGAFDMLVADSHHMEHDLDEQIIVNESVRWIIARRVNLEAAKMKGMSLSMAITGNDTLLSNIIYRHATPLSAADFNSMLLGALTNSKDSARLQRTLDLNHPPWHELGPTVFANALLVLSQTTIHYSGALAREQTALRLLHQGGGLLTKVPPTVLTQILLQELTQLVKSWAPTPGRPSSSQRYENMSAKITTSHTLIRALCRSGISFKPGAVPCTDPEPRTGLCDGCIFPHFLRLLHPERETIRLYHDRIAPIIRAMVENGADMLSACQAPGCMANGVVPISEVVNAAHYQVLHCMLGLSPDVLRSERYMEMNLRLLHRAVELPPRTRKPLQSVLRVIALLIQHGADVTELDDDGYAPLHHVLVRLVCAPPSLKVGSLRIDGRARLLDYHDRLPRLLRLLWDPRLADVVVKPPTVLLREWREESPLRSVWWWPAQPLTTAEYMRLALSGETGAGDTVDASKTTNKDIVFSVAARRETALGLAKHFRAVETSEGKLEISVLPVIN